MWNRIRRHLSQFFLKIAFYIHASDAFSIRVARLQSPKRRQKGKYLYMLIQNLDRDIAEAFLNEKRTAVALTKVGVVHSSPAYLLEIKLGYIFHLLIKAVQNNYKLKEEILFVEPSNAAHKIQKEEGGAVYSILASADKQQRAGIKFMPCWSFFALPAGILGQTDYKTITEELKENGLKPHSHNQIFWEGEASPRRKHILTFGATHAFCDFRNKDNKNKQELGLSNCYQYKYLLDTVGLNDSADFIYSWRLKHLLHTRRVIFMTERFAQEYWYEHLKAWEHYVPVKMDLSDLEEKYNQLEADPALYAKIAGQASDFAKQHLTQEAVLDFMRQTMFQTMFKPL